VTTRKVSVTLDAEALTRARRAAGRRGVSAYVDAALREKLEREQARLALIAYLDELERDDPTPDDVKQRGVRRARRIRERLAGD
jgi:hypothetical protein